MTVLWEPEEQEAEGERLMKLRRLPKSTTDEQRARLEIARESCLIFSGVPENSPVYDLAKRRAARDCARYAAVAR